MPLFTQNQDLHKTRLLFKPGPYLRYPRMSPANAVLEGTEVATGSTTLALPRIDAEEGKTRSGKAAFRVLPESLDVIVNGPNPRLIVTLTVEMN